MEDIIVKSGLLSKKCYETFFVNFNLMDSHCIRLLFSKLLGYAIIAGSVGVKLPQIINIFKSKSAKGVSLFMFIVEAIGYSINLAYNIVMKNPFSTWGENAFLLIQTVILVSLIFQYTSRSNVTLTGLLTLLIAFNAVMLSGTINEYMPFLQMFSIISFSASKIPQVYWNFYNKSTGKLAFLTFFLNLLGSLARVFTTLQEVSDPLILISAISGVILNGTITLQILIYGDRKVKEM